MAKKPDLSNPFARTDQGGGKRDRGEDPTRAIGVALKSSEWEAFEEIANEVGKKRGALLSWAVRWFIKEYRAGNIPTSTKKSLTDL